MVLCRIRIFDIINRWFDSTAIAVLNVGTIVTTAPAGVSTVVRIILPHQLWSSLTITGIKARHKSKTSLFTEAFFLRGTLLDSNLRPNQLGGSIAVLNLGTIVTTAPAGVSMVVRVLFLRYLGDHALITERSSSGYVALSQLTSASMVLWVVSLARQFCSKL